MARPNFLKSIFLGCLGIVLASPPISQTFAAENITWKKMPGAATDISIGGGWVWILSKTTASGGYTAQRWNIMTKKWDTISGAAGTSIDVDPEGNAWVGNTTNVAVKYDGSKWVPSKTNGRDFAVGDGLSPWAIETHINSDGNSFLLSYRRFRRQWLNEPPSGIRLDVGLNGQVWYVKRDNTIGRYTGTLPKNNRLTQTSDWNTVAGTAIDVSIGEDDTVWAIGTNKKPMKWTGNAWQNQTSPVGLKIIAVDRSGLPWAIAANGDIYAASGSVALLPPPNPNMAILQRTNSCKKCDLSGANLNNWQLQNAKLDGANLSGANLTNAQLSGASLIGANLSNTDLKFANLTSAKVTQANLQRADLRGADLGGANLTRADLRNARASRYGSKTVHMSRANFTNADLSAADFTRTDMRGSTLTGAKLVGTGLAGAIMSDMKLASLNFSKANLESTDLRRSTLTSANFSRAHMDKAKLGSASAVGANFINAALRQASLLKADIRKADFSRTDMWQSHFSGANAKGANFHRANLEGAWFDNVVAMNANFKGAKFNKTRILGTVFDGAIGDEGKCLPKSTGTCICQHRSRTARCHPKF